MNIEYYTKTIYGKDTMYIVDKTTAERVQILTGRKTINSNDMIALQALGFTLTEVIAPKQ